jgi:protoheme IX farnesyltransferase
VFRIFAAPALPLEKAIAIPRPRLIAKLYDYGVLIKFKLLLFVVFSAALAYLFASGGAMEWGRFLALALGGFLVTGAANGLNEVFEKDYDRLMPRTRNRPLPEGRMGVGEAVAVSLGFGLAGIWVLAHYVNLLSGVLGMIALFTYAFAYTPMKRMSPFAVFVGAIPGAMPPLIGWVAATGQLGYGAFLLFALQFFWQFPHFWAIAWRLDDQYRQAGFRLLPSPGGKDKASAFQVLVYTVALLPVGLLPYSFNYSGPVSAAIITLAGLLFTAASLKLYRRCTDAAARQVMFASIIYLPVVLIALALDKT